MPKKYASIWVISLLVVLGACTAVPPTIEDVSPSFDGGLQNSGFLGFTNGMALITVNAWLRYNSLIERYGNQIIPPLEFNAGVTTNVPGVSYLLDKQHLVDFATMNRWFKAGVPVTPSP